MPFVNVYWEGKGRASLCNVFHIYVRDLPLLIFISKEISKDIAHIPNETSKFEIARNGQILSRPMF